MSRIITALFTLIPLITSGQFAASFHQTSLPFVGFSYEFADRIRPELRLGTDRYLEDLTVEGVVAGDLLNKEDYEVYLGIGARAGQFEGFVIPVGLNIYPLPNKNFGLHIEMAPIIGDDSILRGSWGIRYRFKKSMSNE